MWTRCGTGTELADAAPFYFIIGHSLFDIGYSPEEKPRNTRNTRKKYPYRIRNLPYLNRKRYVNSLRNWNWSCGCRALCASQICPRSGESGRSADRNARAPEKSEMRTLLTQVAEFYGSAIPITIFLDNAKYQHCQLVCNHAKMLGIELEFLPSYSPNLNLIERYWKWIKKRCLYSKYYENFSAMKSEILNRMSKGHQEDKKELSSLITCNFQTFSNVTFLAV